MRFKSKCAGTLPFRFGGASKYYRRPVKRLRRGRFHEAKASKTPLSPSASRVMPYQTSGGLDPTVRRDTRPRSSSSASRRHRTASVMPEIFSRKAPYRSSPPVRQNKIRPVHRPSRTHKFCSINSRCSDTAPSLRGRFTRFGIVTILLIVRSMQEFYNVRWIRNGRKCSI